MFFQNVYDKTLAQASYIIGCQATGEALVIDAKRDVDTYLQIAKQNNLRITHIAETHIHADFLCGSRELAALTGAKMYLSDEGGPDWQYEFDHVGLKHGDEFTVGNLTVETLHTPGHTPESISFLLTDNPASDKPIMLFSGDFVFVGDIGRPDLLETAAGLIGTKELGAKQMYASLQRFSELPDYIQVWPAHGAGSACGKALGAVPSSTVGYEKIRNWAFSFPNNEQAFVDALLDGQPEPPKYFAMMKKLNKINRPLLTEVPAHPKLSKDEFVKAYQQGITVIDTRNKFVFADGHIPNSINIQGNNSFATWAGWFLNYQDPFILIAEAGQMEDLTRKLMRIGLDNIMGYIDNPHEMGIPLQKADHIELKEFKEWMDKENVQIVDIRNQSEFDSGHIQNADHVFIGTLPEHLDKISKDKTVLIHCQSGDRSSIGWSLLKKAGFNNIKNYSGGMKAWKENNNPITVKP